MSWVQIIMMLVAVWVIWSIFIRPLGMLLLGLLTAVFTFLKEIFNLLARIVHYFNKRNRKANVSRGKPSVMVTGQAIHMN